MQIIELELSQDSFFCPVTGHHIQGAQHFEPSPAMVAGWHSEIIDEPLALEDPVKDPWDAYVKKVDEADEGYDIKEFLRGIKNENLVCFEITTGGMACGPVWSTVWFVIDFNYEESSIEES